MSISIKNLTYIYNEGTPFEGKALDDVSLEINDTGLVGLIGHTGSGKSTLIQHLNGLLKPTSGSIIIDGMDVTDSQSNLTEIRKKVGVVFQYPEYQLFEETIYKDISFGPINLGLDEDEVEKRVKEAMTLVGLDFDKLKDRSPFDLSGGQKRRVAIAGIIAMKPSVLILDEPMAGLDPKGRAEIIELIKGLNNEYNMTIILSSHSMEDMALLVEKLIVMYNGKIEYVGHPKEIFSHETRLKEIGLGIPQVLELVNRLREKGFEIREDILSIEDAKVEILEYIRRNKNA